MPQLALDFDVPRASAERKPPPERKTIDERFATFLAVNPQVYTAFRDAAWKLRAVGHRRIGAKRIVEGLRFNRSLETIHIGMWKIDNNFTSRLARKLIAEDPTFGDFFELRKIRSE